jgi:hypothetical protein
MVTPSGIGPGNNPQSHRLMVQCNIYLCIAQSRDGREKGFSLQSVKHSDSGPTGRRCAFTLPRGP